MAFMLQLRIAGQPVLIDADLVQAVIRVGRLHPVPAVAADVAGLITLRGAVITVIDPAVMLAGERSPPAEQERVAIVVRLDGHAYALLCDAAEEVFELAGDGFDPPPPGLAPAWARVATGTAVAEGRRLAVIDPLRLVPQPAAALPADEMA